MATLYITEFKEMGDAKDGKPQIPQHPALANQTVTTSGTAASSAAFDNDTTYLRIVYTGAIHYIVNGTATTSHTYLPSGAVEYIGLSSGDTLSAIDA